MWHQVNTARPVLGVCLLALSALVHAGSPPKTLADPLFSIASTESYRCGSGVTLSSDGSLAIVAADCFMSNSRYAPRHKGFDQHGLPWNPAAEECSPVTLGPERPSAPKSKTALRQGINERNRVR